MARARKARTKWEGDFSVERGERYYLGQQWTSLGRREKEKVWNHLSATIKTILPSLLYANPKFYIRPQQGLKPPAQTIRARMGESVLEAIGDHDDNLKDAAKLALQQAFFRVGCVKVCYDPRLEPNPRAGQPIMETQEDGTPLIVDGQTQPKRDPLTGEPVLEPVEVLTDELYQYEWVDARHLLLPTEGANPKKWTWVGEEITVPLSDAKEDSRWPKELREKLQANSQFEKKRDDRGRFVTSEGDDTFLTYIEYYDLKAKTMKQWADGQVFNDFLYNGPLPDGIDDHPYSFLFLGDAILGPEPSPWPKPPVFDWLDPQTDYNLVRMMISTGTRRSARKGVFFDGTFENEEEAIKLLENPDDMAFARVTDPKLIPQVLQVPDLNQAVYKSIPILLNDWRTITGQTGARLGDPEDSTATESSFMERSANLRDADMQDKVQKFLTTLGRKMYQLVKQTLTLNLYVQLRTLSDTDFQRYVEQVLHVPAVYLQLLPALKEALKDRLGDLKWMSVTREDLIFEADVTVVPGSARPRNLDVERRQFIAFLQLLGQFPQLALSPQLMNRVLEMFDIRDEALSEELMALAQQMVQINANQAGRSQGAGEPSNGALPTAQAALSGVTGGSM